MKLLSLRHLQEQGWAAFKRFYIPIAFSIAGTICAVNMVGAKEAETLVMVKVLLACLLGLPFSIACSLYAERAHSMSSKLIAKAVAILLPVLYGVFLSPENLADNNGSAILFFVLLVVAHLFVSVSAYLRVQEYDGFWRFNEQLFLRMFLSVVFSGVLFGGLALAIASVDNLFQVSVNEKRYGQLWCMVADIFNTWFFVAGIPADYAAINEKIDFPKRLKLFAQYILLPLATLYLVILYAYGIKILAVWSLPKGWVSLLIMWYAVLGILAILLVYPLRDQKDNTWIRLFTRIFFIALLPLIVLLYAAILERTKAYGITEPRYYLALLGAWLAFIAFYFILSPKKNIKMIPVSLMIAGLLSICGPWSSFNISTHSQVRQMREILRQYGISKTANGMTLPAKPVAKEDADRLYSIVQYLLEKHELAELNDIYGQNMEQVAEHIKTRNKKDAKKKMYYYSATAETRDTLLAMLHVNMNDAMYRRESYIRYDAPANMLADIAGYDKLYEYRYNGYDDETEKAIIATYRGDSLELVMKNIAIPELLINNRDSIAGRFDLKPVTDSVKKNKYATFRIPAQGKIDAMMIVSRFELNIDSIKRPIEEWQGYILLHE